MERWATVAYFLMPATITGVIMASPTAKGSRPTGSTSQGLVKKLITPRATMQNIKPMISDFLMPMVSTREPIITVMRVSTVDQAVTTKPALTSPNCISLESHKISVELTKP